MRGRSLTNVNDVYVGNKGCPFFQGGVVNLASFQTTVPPQGAAHCIPRAIVSDHIQGRREGFALLLYHGLLARGPGSSMRFYNEFTFFRGAA